MELKNRGRKKINIFELDGMKELLDYLLYKEYVYPQPLKIVEVIRQVLPQTKNIDTKDLVKTAEYQKISKLFKVLKEHEILIDQKEVTHKYNLKNRFIDTELLIKYLRTFSEIEKNRLSKTEALLEKCRYFEFNSKNSIGVL